jgi:uncharacterized cupin superfamily protein
MPAAMGWRIGVPSASDVKSGSPRQRGRTYSDAPDIRLSAGVWDCTALEGTMALPVDEFMILLEGSVTVTEASEAPRDAGRGR